MNRTAGFMTLQLSLLLVSRHSKLVTRELLSTFISLWSCEPLRQFSTPPAIEEAADPHERVFEVGGHRRNATKTVYIFQDVFSSPGLQSMMVAGRTAFDAMEVLLIELLVARLLTIDHLNQQCVRLLRQEWPMVNTII